ncbi:ATP-binding protein [Brevibacillus nitrificans]|uniref:ATP-binding protein n=1 Tax=Brevibacillus nitrificans TaxID=651560 RepID=UPI00286AAF3B|nr:ATP-binding protein [Brevibacillus nitrificans]
MLKYVWRECILLVTKREGPAFVYLKDFLLNIFIIFSPLVFYPYLFKNRSNVFYHRLLLYVLFAAALLLSMSFPVKVNEITYGFRSVPLAIASLYGGPVVSILLYVTLLIYRFLLGSPNNFLYALSILPSFAFVLLLYKNYPYQKLYQKISVAILLCTAIKLTTFTTYFFITQGSLQQVVQYPLATLNTYILQAVIIGVCVYAMEFLQSYFYMQEEVIKSEKTKIVSDMAASVAHEIRNPLTTVRGFIQLLAADDVDKQKKQFYQRICLEELDRAQLIISDYLSLAKPDPESIEVICVHEEITYLSNLLITFANYNNIQIHKALPEDQALQIIGDRYKFRQALINIGKNAIEALRDGGTLEIRASKKNDHIIINLNDTGIGMTAEQIKRLGTPYYSTKDKGTGLGTMVSFGIIKKMSGKIEITSEPGKGTEYKLTFPSSSESA